MKRFSPHSDFRNPIAWVIWTACVCAGALVFISRIVQSSRYEPFEWTVFESILICIIGWVLPVPIRAAYRAIRVVIANRILLVTARQLLANESTDYQLVVYLRPHWLDGLRGIPNPVMKDLDQLPVYPIPAWLLDPRFWTNSSLMSLDEFLARVLDTSCVLSLGERTMKLATGSFVVSDDVWKEIVNRLLSRAACIVYVPDTSSGLIWEFSQIQMPQCVDRVVLIEPPDMGNLAVKRMIRAGNCRRECMPTSWINHWNLVRAYFSERFRCELPEYIAQGRAVSLSMNPTSFANSVVMKINEVLDHNRKN